MFKRLLKVKDISDYEHHSCEMGCTGWRPTPQRDWDKCKEDKNSKCHGKRFKTVMGRLVPVRVRVVRASQGWLVEAWVFVSLRHQHTSFMASQHVAGC